MCETCELDLENYNRSLKIKTNLLNADHRQSQLHSNDSSMLDNAVNAKMGGVPNNGTVAPKNADRSNSLDNLES